MLSGDGIPATLAGVVIAASLFGLIGVGLGGLLREQVVTVVALLLYLFVVEPVLTGISTLDTWTIYLPGPARGALTQTTLTFRDFLPPLQGGRALAAYGIALAAFER